MKTKHVEDPRFSFDEAPKEAGRYPIPSLLVTIQASRWLSIEEQKASETEMGNPLGVVVQELQKEIAAQQHRFVIDGFEVRSGGGAAVESPPPKSGRVPETIGGVMVTQADLHQAVATIMADHDEFASLSAKEFIHLVGSVVAFVFE